MFGHLKKITKPESTWFVNSRQFFLNETFVRFSEHPARPVLAQNKRDKPAVNWEDDHDMIPLIPVLTLKGIGWLFPSNGWVTTTLSPDTASQFVTWKSALFLPILSACWRGNLNTHTHTLRKYLILQGGIIPKSTHSILLDDSNGTHPTHPILLLVTGEFFLNSLAIVATPCLRVWMECLLEGCAPRNTALSSISRPALGAANVGSNPKWCCFTSGNYSRNFAVLYSPCIGAS